MTFPAVSLRRRTCRNCALWHVQAGGLHTLLLAIHHMRCPVNLVLSIAFAYLAHSVVVRQRRSRSRAGPWQHADHSWYRLGITVSSTLWQHQPRLGSIYHKLHLTTCICPTNRIALLGLSSTVSPCNLCFVEIGCPYRNDTASTCHMLWFHKLMF